MRASDQSESNNLQQQERSTKRPLHRFLPLRTKLAILPVHPASIFRPLLVDRLNKGKEFKLTVISAPTGFGKTTLLSEWAHQSALPVVWISLSDSDNDLTHFLAYLIAALSSLSEHIDTDVLTLLPLNQQETLLVDMLNFITLIPEEFVLVLDDYHTIQNSSIHTTLISLLEFLPQHMHIFIASRTRPPLSLSRLRANRQLQELRPADLLFTLEEVERFLTQTMGQKPRSGQAKAIKELTEGWIAILHLISIWLHEQKEGWEALERVSGNQRYIFEYLVEEVLLHQPPVIQSFLLQTSILTQFNSSLCDALTEKTNSSLALEQIERTNLFLTPLDDQQNWYCYHPIFRTFLYERLKQTSPDLVSILHDRACNWYEAHEMYSAAISHALAIQDYERSAEILLICGENMLICGEASTLLALLREIPEELVRLYPLLCLLSAWSLMLLGQFDEAETWISNIDYLEKKTSFVVGRQKHTALSHKTSDLQRISIFTSVLSRHVAIFWGDIDSVMSDVLNDPIDVSNENTFIQSLNDLNVGIAIWLAGRISEAEEIFEAVAAKAKSASNIYILLAANCGMATTHIMSGERRYAFEIIRQALQLLEQHKSYLSPFSVYLYTEASYLLTEWNRLDEATYYAKEALAYGQKESRDILVYAYILFSHIEWAKGNFDESQRYMLLAEENMLHSQYRPWIRIRMAAQAVNLALKFNDMERAEYWSQIPELRQFGSMATFLPMSVHLARNQPQEALQLGQIYLATAEDETHTLLVKLLQACAYQELHNMPQAHYWLDQVLRRAEPQGYIRFFLDEGPKCAQLLRAQLEMYETQIVQTKDTSSLAPLIQYLYLLLAAFAGEEPIALTSDSYSVSSSSSKELPNAANLSKREIEVLSYITEGLSTEEVAQRLHLARSTVKWYIKNIYSKLQVRNRAQVIMEAQRLHLL